MRWLDPEKTALRYNAALTLEGFPAQAHGYRLGNRSALDWIVDQYHPHTDPKSGIESDPNNPDDERYILRLLGQVTTVSLETLKIVESLPEDFGAATDGTATPQKQLREWRMSPMHWMNSSGAQQQREELETSLKVQEATTAPSTPPSSGSSSSNGRTKKGSRSKRTSG